MRIELSSGQLRKLQKGKELVVHGVTVAAKGTSYKELYKQAKYQIYSLRYQLKKVKNGKKEKRSTCV